MKSKDKVLKIRPDAFCRSIGYYQVVGGYAGSIICLGNPQTRESWAWADAYRNLTKKPL